MFYFKAGDVEPTPGEQPQPQQGRFNMIFSVAKTLIVRSLIIYFITSMFKKPTTAPSEGANPIDSVPHVNYFEFGTHFVSISFSMIYINFFDKMYKYNFI